MKEAEECTLDKASSLAKNHNIKVAPDSDNIAPKGHVPAADGKSPTVPLDYIAKREVQINMLTKHYNDVRKNKKVKCEFRIVDGMKPAVVGTYKREPFVIYASVFHEGKEWAAIVVTRFKGDDYGARPPLEVLKNV